MFKGLLLAISSGLCEESEKDTSYTEMKSQILASEGKLSGKLHLSLKKLNLSLTND